MPEGTDAMAEDRWGPFPALAEQLAKLGAGPWGWAEEAESLGGLWALAARDLWPDSLVRPARPETGQPVKRYILNWWQRLWAWLLRRWGRLPPQTPKPPPPSPFSPRHVGETLAACHAWLTRRLMAFYLEKCQPFGPETPLEMARGSEAGVFWTLAAYILERDGPEGLTPVLDFLSRPSDPSPLARYALEGRECWGDVISQHLNLETVLLSRSGPDSARKKAPAPDLSASKPGGFRSLEFIRAYLTWTFSPKTRKETTWWSTFETLARRSPFTCLVYGELVQGDPWVGLGGLLPQSPSPSPAWNAFFWSQLARTLVGMAHSPPPAYGRWQEAENRARQKRKRNISGAEEEAARQECQELAREVTRQHLARLRNLAQVLSRNDFLHLRFVDLWLRGLLLQAAPELPGFLAAENRPRPGQPLRNVVLMTRNPAYRRFEAFLCGPAAISQGLGGGVQVSDLPGLMPGGEEELRSCVHQLCQVPDPDPEGLAHQAGVLPEEAARLALARFHHPGPLLALGERPEAAPELARILATWLTDALNQLEDSQVQVMEM